MFIDFIRNKIIFNQAFFYKALFTYKLFKLLSNILAKIFIFKKAIKFHKFINMNIFKFLNKIFIHFHLLKHFIFKLMKNLVFYWNFKEILNLFFSSLIFIKWINLYDSEIICLLLEFFIFFINNLLDILL